MPDVPTVTQEENMLTSSEADSYQWYLNDVQIVGAVNQTYIFTQNGIYFVEITNEYGCTAKSREINVTDLGIVIITNHELRIYPNPAQDQLRIERQQAEGSTQQAEIYDIYGRKLSAFCLLPSVTTIDISHLANGIYFLKIGNKTARFVKE